MIRFRRRPIAARLADELARTGCTATTWWAVSDLTWRCRIDGMSGYWLATSEDDAKRILIHELRRVPDRESDERVNE